MRHDYKRNLFWLSGVAMVLCAAGSWLWAQADEDAGEAGIAVMEEQQPAGRPDVRAPADDEGENHVTDIRVNTFSDTDAYLRMAERKVAEQDYGYAFQIYMRVLEQWPDLMFRVHNNLYYGVARHVRQRMMAIRTNNLGPEAVTREGQAQRLFNRARADMDEGILRALEREYFWTGVGGPAVELLGDIALERDGAIDAVSAYWRLLAEYRLDDADALRVRRKLVVALSAAGDVSMRRRVLEELVQAAGPGVMVSDGRGLVAASELLERHGGAEPVAWGADWPEFMGRRDRTGRARDAVDADARLWHRLLAGNTEPAARLLGSDDLIRGRFDSPAPEEKLVPARQAMMRHGHPMAGRPSGANPTGLSFESFPVVSGDRVMFVQDDRLVALDRLTGDLLWEVGNPFGSDPGASIQQGPGQRRGVQFDIPVAHTLTVRGSLLFGLRRSDAGYELLAVDVATGKRVGMLPGEGMRADFLQPGRLSSGFAEHNGRLYLAFIEGQGSGGHGHLDFGYERLVGLDVHNPSQPKLLWDTLLYGTANFSAMMNRSWDSFSGSPVPPVHVPTIGGDSVFYNSNNGAIASVDAMTGDLCWLYTYARYVPERSRRALAAEPSPLFSYTASPVYYDGIVFCMPSDAWRMFALDAHSGRLLWSVPRDGLSNVVGLRGDTLYLSGNRVVAVDIRTGQAQWVSPMDDIIPVGRGAAADRQIYVPARFVDDGRPRDLVLRFDADTGKMLKPIAMDPYRDEIGNLVLAGDTLLSMNSRRITAFGNAGQHLGRIEARLVEAPGDPVALLRLGQIRHSRGQFDEAIDAFAEALASAGAGRFYQEGPLEELLTARLYSLHRERLANEYAEERFDDALATARKGLGYAVGPHQQVEARLAEALLLEALGRPAEAASIYQETKLEHPLVVYRIDAGQEMTVRVYADIRIDGLVAEHGREAYRLVEAEAQRLLASDDPDAWHRVVIGYGPAEARPEALLKLAARSEEAGDIRRAARYYAQFYRSYRGDTRAVAMAARAMALYDRDGALIEAGQLAKRVRRYSFDAPLDIDGQRLTGGEFAASLIARPDIAQALALPGETIHPLDLPLTRRWSIEKNNANARSATAATRPFDRDGRMLALRAANQPRPAVEVYDAETGALLWSHQAKNHVHRAELSPDGRRMVVISHASIECLDSLTGELLWQARPAELNQARPMRIQTNRPLGMTVSGSAMFLLYAGNVQIDNQRTRALLIVAYRLDTGKLSWMAQVDGNQNHFQQEGGRLLVMDDMLVIGTMVNDPANQKAAVYAWNVESGKLVRRLDLPGRGVMGEMARLDDHRAFAIYFDARNRGRIGLFDAAVGEFAWSSPLVAGHWNSSVLVSGRQVIIWSNHSIEAFDITSGLSLWAENLSRQRRMVADVKADAMGAYLLHVDQQTQFGQVIERRDIETGALQWQYDLPHMKAAFRLAQSEDYLVTPIAEGRLRRDLPNAQMMMTHCQFEKVSLVCIDKETGARSFIADAERLDNALFVRIQQPLAIASVSEDAVYLDAQNSLYTFSGR